MLPGINITKAAASGAGRKPKIPTTTNKQSSPSTSLKANTIKVQLMDEKRTQEKLTECVLV